MPSCISFKTYVLSSKDKHFNSKAEANLLYKMLSIMQYPDAYLVRWMASFLFEGSSNVSI